MPPESRNLSKAQEAVLSLPELAQNRAAVPELERKLVEASELYQEKGKLLYQANTLGDEKAKRLLVETNRQIEEKVRGFEGVFTKEQLVVLSSALQYCTQEGFVNESARVQEVKAELIRKEQEKEDNLSLVEKIGKFFTTAASKVPLLAEQIIVLLGGNGVQLWNGGKEFVNVLSYNLGKGEGLMNSLSLAFNSGIERGVESGAEFIQSRRDASKNWTGKSAFGTDEEFANTTDLGIFAVLNPMGTAAEIVIEPFSNTYGAVKFELQLGVYNYVQESYGLEKLDRKGFELLKKTDPALQWADGIFAVGRRLFQKRRQGSRKVTPAFELIPHQ